MFSMNYLQTMVVWASLLLIENYCLQKLDSEVKRLKVEYQKAMQEYKASGGGMETATPPAKKS